MSGTNTTTETSAEDLGSWVGRAWSQVGTIVVAVAIALTIRAFVVEPFRIPSGSMLPTLLIGDHLFVNKFAYGIKLPFGDTRLPGLRDPERGEVIVFTVARKGPGIFPADRRPDLRREEFVKRIVGLPGDEISVRDGVLTVNGQALPRTDGGETFQDEAGRELRLLTERAEGTEYRVLDDPRMSGLVTRGQLTVEPGRYFVMGDNRDHSNDSRAWGTVALAQIKGPAFVLYWSWNYNDGWLALLNPLTWWRLLTEETRWDRIGDAVR